jgi:hypothetical protein
VPMFLIYDDARFFYATNVLLAFSGLILFYIVLLRITRNGFASALVLFLYLTNYFIYWYPNLPMAENLTLTLFIAGLFVLTSKVSSKIAMLAGALSVSFYAAKYANAVLSLVFGAAYFLKIVAESHQDIFNKKIETKKLKPVIVFISSGFVTLFLFFFIEYLIRGGSIFEKIQYLMEPLFLTDRKGVAGQVITNPWFSYAYFDRNFNIYSKALLGESMRFLWDFTPLLPRYIALASLVGILAGLIYKGKRLFSLALLAFVLLPVLFLSTFYTADARYIYHVIPAMLCGLGLLLYILKKLVDKKNLAPVFYIFLAGLFIFYCMNNYVRLRYQVTLNLRHAETPWNYLSVKNFNEFFSGSPQGSSPVLVTAMPPYYVDFLAEGNYKLLPLSTEQEFSNSREIVWGEEDYSDFIKIYGKYLSEGKKVFVTNAGLGNHAFLYRDYNKIKDNFDLKLVKEGCLNTCNIYELSLKKP